jgi:hypothetical protein
VTTLAELDRDGRIVRIFHRAGQRRWVHPLGEPIMRDRGEIVPCPVCAR